MGRSSSSAAGLQAGLLLLLAAMAVCAEPIVLVHDAQGALLRQAPAVWTGDGHALVAASALADAHTAVLYDASRLYRVVAVTGEDRDAGLVELFVGVQAPKAAPLASANVMVGRAGAHDTKTAEYREVGGFGAVARLDCSSKKNNEVDAPLYNQHGFVAGWHAVRMVDGGVAVYAIPWTHIQQNLTRVARLDVAAWAAARNASNEETYSRALACLWSNDYDGAAFYLRKSSELEPTNARVWFHLAFMEGKTGHSKAKLAAFRKSIELDPNYAPAHYNLGIALAMIHDGEGARNEVKVLQSLDLALARRLAGFLDLQHSDALPPAKHADTKRADKH